MKQIVAAMLTVPALAGGCATVGGADERPRNPWVVVDGPWSEEWVRAYRYMGPFGFEQTALTEYEIVRLLHRKAQAECAKHGRWAGAPSRGELSLEFPNPWPPGSSLDSPVWVEVRSVPCLVVGGCKEPEPRKPWSFREAKLRGDAVRVLRRVEGD